MWWNLWIILVWIIGKTTIPISVTLSLLSSYLILGAVLFSEWEKWKFLDGAYFCFITLATIGLGENNSFFIKT